LTLEVL